MLLMNMRRVNVAGRTNLLRKLVQLRTMMDSAKASDDPHLLHLFDGGPTNVYSKDHDNLSVGAPGPDLLRLCVKIMQNATLHRMESEKENPYLFQYGIPCGLWEFREDLSHFLSELYGGNVNRKDLVLTCGATHGLQLILGTFLSPNAVIFVEEATYMIALSAFKQYPLMKIVPVPLNNDGVDTEAFKKIALEEKSKGKWMTDEQRPFWAVLYTIPLFHNPTGITMSEGCSQSLIHMARELDILIACDDVYNLLYYGSKEYPPKRLFAYDTEMDGYEGGHVISNCSVSKIMAPALRVGWLEAPPRLTNILRESGVLVSGGGVNQYMAGLITSAIKLGTLKSHLNVLKKTFQDRMFSLCEVLSKNLPDGCSARRPDGGYFVWIILPETVDANDFLPWCKEYYKVSALPGNIFSPVGKFRNCIRLAISFHDKERLSAAGYRLCQALTEYFKINSIVV
ncbi:2-aminoadipate transaminase [Schistocerca gregaria]|uniref:2-aminoadipate transaminase n=1 Tax=Schistocerca gregaria TaxID=7010 RepID=UPI00211DC5D0|nr:2-aminoadipate transaminase [Schistocerca gregaria]XP_049828364.1 2-aminoadipate transaminase [Schistocerca gregaria]